MSESMVEKITFAAAPILVAAVGYLMTALSEADKRITILESKITVVVDGNNQAIAPQGSTLALEQLSREAAINRAEIREEAALARAELDKRLTVIEYKLETE
jgi:Zn-dependent metalloprotease